MALNTKNTRNSEYAELDFTFTNSSTKSYKYRDSNGVLGLPSGQTVDGWENILVKFHAALFLQLYPGIHSLKVTSGDKALS